MDDKWLVDAIGEVQHRWTPAVGSGFAAMGMLLGMEIFWKHVPQQGMLHSWDIL